MSKVQVIQASKGASAERVPVAAYCRVSSKSEDQGHSFAAQVREYTAQIESNPKWTLAGIYADEGISGISARKRPEFQRLIEDCRQGKVKRILTKSISRFARNTQECLEYVRELKLLGVSVCFEKEGLDTRDMAGELLVSVFGSLAQEESISISKNVRMSNQRRMERGEFISGLTPYGYRRTGAQLQIYEPEADIVRWIFRQYLNGVPEKDIVKAVKIMDAEINAGSTSRAWTRHTIAYIIKNERYVGDMLLQKNYTALSDPPRRMINYGEVARYYVENSHPAIISRADFNKAQALRKKRSGTQTLQHETPLQRRLVCEECGSVFKKRINKKGIIRWSCYKHDTDRRACPTMPVADALIWDAFTWMIKILMVKRMLENERYTGKDGYPIIIQKELFERAFMIRKSKAVKTERKEKPQDKLPCITPAETRNFPTDIRVARLENQINWELSRSILEPERLKAKIFQCAVMKYDALRIHVNKKPNKTLDTDNADFDI